MTAQNTAAKLPTGYALDHLLQMPIDSDKLELAFAAAKAAYGSVPADDGTEVAIAQPPYLSDDLGEMHHEARGIDAKGNGYDITWSIKESIRALPAEDQPEDESDYCEWDEPSEVALVERA